MVGRAVAACALLLAVAAAASAVADEALWRRLRGGGHVVMIRHGSTDAGVGDPPGFRPGDCRTQRNLNEAGRDEARRIGEAFRTHGVAVGAVLSSEWCRCLDTARLAFGRAEPWAPLNSVFERADLETRTTPAVKTRVAALPAGPNVVMVTHNVNIRAVTGVSTAPGEMVVLAPDGRGGFAVVGRLRVDQMGRP